MVEADEKDLPVLEGGSVRRQSCQDRGGAAPAALPQHQQVDSRIFWIRSTG
jgi:hypothetical protein